MTTAPTALVHLPHLVADERASGSSTPVGSGSQPQTPFLRPGSTNRLSEGSTFRGGDHERDSMDKPMAGHSLDASIPSLKESRASQEVEMEVLDSEPPIGNPEAMFDREKHALEDAPPPPPAASDDFPDGGFRAWLVVASCFCCTMATFGYVNAWGAFQAYYVLNNLHDRTQSDIAWIGSIQYALTFMPNLFIGRLFDLDKFRIPVHIATVVMAVSTILVAECKEYWQFVLCQGIVTGTACGIVFGPAVSAASQYFKRKRSTAIAIVACGSSVGGTIFPIAFNQLEKHVGFKWTMRILGLLQFAILILPNLFMKRRLPVSEVKGKLFALAAFRKLPLFLYTVSGFLCFLGLYTVLTYIEVSAKAVHISPDKAFYLVSIANAASGAGRLGSGFAADRFGPLSVIIPMTALAGVLTYVWPFITSYAGFAVLAVFYGAAAGVFVALIVTPTIALGELRDVGQRIGMYFTILALGALAGPPISGAIEKASGGFKVVGYYAGSTVMIAVGVMIVVRRLVLGGWSGKF